MLLFIKIETAEDARSAKEFHSQDDLVRFLVVSL